MPKVVDHNQRRRDIIDAAWRLIVRGGFETATMREIAAETGFANGALKLYFSTKEQLVHELFETTLAQFSARIAAETQGLRGLDALRRSALITLPISVEATTASHIFMALWHLSTTDVTLRERYRVHLVDWYEGLSGYVRDAKADGEVAAGVSESAVAKQLIHYVIGANVLVAIGGNFAGGRDHRAYLSDLLESLRVTARV
ncbi:AcrR family transcriptional regulator [Microbacterium sp. SORGH_AS 1204]|uniref:TetR/AcrR family transcriptional regulator n=1 Tax=Microbacterium sp. SORGH_AS_1204 TaxID=3041785 RepID=UPI00278FF7D9|nr:TetR/AcrR family transcriptional regulator [Microbacterium sp. SORGH_AS_1204]MDQ1136302.1 AcrR family transcriptional regulator [Microbacterium sp. SORGH_AS_1204]